MTSSDWSKLVWVSYQNRGGHLDWNSVPFCPQLGDTQLQNSVPICSWLFSAVPCFGTVFPPVLCLERKFSVAWNCVPLAHELPKIFPHWPTMACPWVMRESSHDPSIMEVMADHYVVIQSRNQTISSLTAYNITGHVYLGHMCPCMVSHGEHVVSTAA